MIICKFVGVVLCPYCLLFLFVCCCFLFVIVVFCRCCLFVVVVLADVVVADFGK